MILAGDIGGTKVNLGCFNAEDLRLSLQNLGSCHIYQFLRDTGRGEELAWLAEEFRKVNDRTALLGAARFAAMKSGRIL